MMTAIPVHSSYHHAVRGIEIGNVIGLDGDKGPRAARLHTVEVDKRLVVGGRGQRAQDERLEILTHVGDNGSPSVQDVVSISPGGLKGRAGHKKVEPVLDVQIPLKILVFREHTAH